MKRRFLTFLITALLLNLLIMVAPALADCSAVPNELGGEDWECTNLTPTVLNGTPGSDRITNHGTVTGYIWSAGFRSLTSQRDTITNYGTVGDGEINSETNEDDDGLWGSAGNDTIINHGIVNGGAVGSIFGDGMLAYGADYDVIIHNGTAYGDVMGDFQARGHDTITINGVVVGSVYGDVAPQWAGYSHPNMQNTGGNDIIILQNGASVSSWLDGNLGSDTLRFAFVASSQAEYDALNAAIAAASPANGSLTFRGRVFNWRNFETLTNQVTLEGAATPTFTPVPPTATNTPTNTPVPPTATNTPTDLPTGAPTNTPTDIPTNTPVPPTATNTPTDTPTNTPVPPTNTPTNTPVPPTATNTPTFTPTFTPTNTPTNTPPPTNTPVPPSSGTVTISVGSGGNDVNEDGSSYVPSFAAVWFGNAGSTTASYTGLRFANINIPQGATILSARLEVYSASQPQWIAISFQYAGEASDNSAPFSAGSKPSQRPLTAARVNHSSSVNWNANTWYQLDDIRVIVQEIINRPGWQSGSSLSLVMTGTGGSWGRKYVWAAESSVANAPRLVITYSQ